MKCFSPVMLLKKLMNLILHTDKALLAVVKAVLQCFVYIQVESGIKEVSFFLFTH